MPQKLVFILFWMLLSPITGSGQGISFDAGLTPAQNRLIVRSQLRAFSASDGTMTTRTQMIPVVIAYGLRPGLTVMARNTYRRQHAIASGDISNAFLDPLVLAKFRLYRKNTAYWVLGVAPHIATNLPLGFSAPAEKRWNPELGLNVSFRPRFISFDLSSVYQINDIFTRSESFKGKVLRINTAIAGVIPISAAGDIAVAPVVEINYLRSDQRRDEELLYQAIYHVSPGASLITNVLTFEVLLKVPIYQVNTINEMVQGPWFITGLKLMF